MDIKTKIKDNDLMRSILFFDTMVMPKIITFIYWLILIGNFIGGIGMMIGGSVLSGIGIWVIGSVGARLWCELMIVLFKINENIQKIADKS